MSDSPIYDPLTGAFTRAWLHDQLQNEVERARRYGHMASLLIFDLDHFKSVNDAFGHARGDTVLVEVARRVQQETRATDQFFRYGGDEFVLLLPNTAKPEATRLAERLLTAIRTEPFDGAVPLKLSLSIGVATFPTDAADDHALFLKADARNYAAKRRGRACVVAEDSLVAPDLPFADVSRLSERDEALELAQRFFADLIAQQRGVLRVVGAAGAGCSRFLAEAEKRARLQGFTIIAIHGTRALKAKPYGALAHIVPEILHAAPARLTLDAFVETISRQLAEAGTDRLLLSIDNLPALDWGTLDLLHQLLSIAAIPVLGLIYTTDPDSARVAVPFAAPVSERVTLQPLSQNGLRIWLRVLMQWEPPAAFISWLEQQTHGMPAQVERVLRQLLKSGGLTSHADGWLLSQDYTSLGVEGVPRRPTAHNLPAALTNFIGRDRELAEVRQLLATARLLTLAGSGGMGKTRLSLELAAGILDGFKDGVWFIELAPLSDPTLVLYTVASVLGVREELSRPLRATVLDWLSSKQILLVLDNCEHLIDACAHFADSALRAGPDVRILASSREPLDILGEQVYRVPSLESPHATTHVPLGQLSHYAAARLFIERATFAQSTFRVTDTDAPFIAQICARLDGIPLAIELAAARTRSLPVEQIAARLDDRFLLLTGGNRTALPRHQTLRALIDWSYSLLSTPERTLLSWLSAFTAGWTREAAEAVCALPAADDGAEIPTWEVASVLTQLVGKSLVVLDEQAFEPRYRMLETIRQYAREKLSDERERERLSDRHLDYYRRLAERAEPIVISAQRDAWVRRLVTEHDNLRAALEWARDSEAARSMAGTLGWFWYFSAQLNEGRAWHLRVLREHAKPSRELAKALNSAGLLSGNLGYSDEARPWLEQSVALCQALGERRLLAEAVFSLAYVLVQIGQDERACALFAEHEACLRDSADALVLGWSLSFWGRALAHARGDYTTAKALHDESVALGQAVQDPSILASAFMNLGHWAAEQGDYLAGQQYHSESLAWRRQSGTQLHVAISAHYVADMLSMQGEYQQAQPLYAEALSLSRALGDQAFIAWTTYRLGYLATHQALYAQALAFFAESLRLYRTQAEPELLTSGLAGCAELCRAQGRFEQAARLLAYVATHPQSAQRLFISAIDRIEYERTIDLLRAQLDAPSLSAAWAAGQVMTLDQAIEYALSAATG